MNSKNMCDLPRMRPRRGISGQENNRYKGQRQATAPFCLRGWLLHLGRQGETPLGDQVSHAVGRAPSRTPAAIPWQQLPTILITNGMLPTFPNIPRSEAVLLLRREKPMNTRKQVCGWNRGWGVRRMGAEDGSR